MEIDEQAEQLALGHVLSALIFTLYEAGHLPKASFLRHLAGAGFDLEDNELPEAAKKLDEWREHLSDALRPPLRRPNDKQS